jgi:hypothetical protein
MPCEDIRESSIPASLPFHTGLFISLSSHPTLAYSSASFSSVLIMKFSSIISLASLASAAPYFHSNEGSPDALNVKLEMVGNSDVKASITNNGNAKLRLLRTGTILGNTPVEKVQVAQNGTILCPLVPKTCSQNI